MTLNISAHVERKEALASAVVTATFSGISIDLDGISAKGIQVIRDAATTYNATNYFQYKIEHSDDNSTWADADYTLVDLGGAELQANDAKFLVDYEVTKRYILIKGVAVGSPIITLRADAILEPKVKPVV